MTDPTVRPRRRGALAAPHRPGTTCTGTLAPHGSGSPGNPVVLAPYGTGTARPVVAGDPSSPENAAVHLLNVEQWEIHGLEITFPDTAATRKERNGLLVEIADLPDGVGSHYLVDDVHVHDVDGDSTKWSNGIQFRVSGTTTPTSFDGIVVRAADHALVEHNTAYDIAMRPMGSNAGIWTIDSDATTVQYNEVHRVRRLSDSNDGMAFGSAGPAGRAPAAPAPWCATT
jgi:hypothetical protein